MADSPSHSRVIAIGDIHGCRRALEVVLDAIEPTPEDLFVPLGDYIDRGPDSCGVIERLIRLESEALVVPLLGNHERMMLSAMEMPGQMPFWLRYGGRETLASYGGSIENIPPTHLVFLSRCRRFYETPTHIFVHANYAPKVSMDRQPEELLFWRHLDEQPPAHISGKQVIVGHTPQTSGQIADFGHLICIDTFCFGSGCLTAMDVISGTLWQADQNGKMKS